MLKLTTLLLALILLSSLALADITCSETMTRTSSATTVAPGSTFTISYTALGVNGLWGATVIDSVSGGCTISVSGTPKTSLQFAMLSDLPNPLTYTVTAPSSGSCTFTGDYMYGSCAANPLNSLTVSISGTCTPSCTGKTCGDDGCGGSCGTCTSPLTCNSAGQCVSSCTDTCSSLGKQCGTQTICGASTNCGTCTSPQVCNSLGICTTTCTDTCSTLGYVCGTQTICGTSTNCGTCATGQTCSNGLCTTTSTFDWCSFATKFNFFQIVEDPCMNGSIIFGIIVLFGVVIFGKL